MDASPETVELRDILAQEMRAVWIIRVEGGGGGEGSTTSVDTPLIFLLLIFLPSISMPRIFATNGPCKHRYLPR